MYSRVEGAADGLWVQNASGVLAQAAEVAAGFDGSVWPPVGADAVDLSGRYQLMAESGYVYGPVFQGLRGVWRRGEEVFAEVVLPEQVEDAAAFGLHPALLDAALQAISLVDPDGLGERLLPFSWNEVSLHAGGASVLRVRLVTCGVDAVSLACLLYTSPSPRD